MKISHKVFCAECRREPDCTPVKGSQLISCTSDHILYEDSKYFQFCEKLRTVTKV